MTHIGSNYILVAHIGDSAAVPCIFFHYVFPMLEGFPNLPHTDPTHLCSSVQLDLVWWIKLNETDFTPVYMECIGVCPFFVAATWCFC